MKIERKKKKQKNFPSFCSLSRKRQCVSFMGNCAADKTSSSLPLNSNRLASHFLCLTGSWMTCINKTVLEATATFLFLSLAIDFHIQRRGTHTTVECVTRSSPNKRKLFILKRNITKEILGEDAANNDQCCHGVLGCGGVRFFLAF